MSPGRETVDAEREFARILDQRLLNVVFQPISQLRSGAIVGYEALIRGPEGSPLASPTDLLAMAYRTGRIVELDWVARAVACRAALSAGMSRAQLLFLNVEPLALDSACPLDLRADIERAFDRYQVVLEVTERSLDRDPATLLDGLDRQRRLVAGFALDDVGSDPSTLSMLPLVAPAIIKLDLGVTQAGPTPRVMQILDLVYEEVERTGATILAEGIETDDHFDLALSFGARLGQGYLIGMPLPLPKNSAADVPMTPLRADTPTTVPTPFDALGGRRMARATATLLRPLIRQLEASGANAPGLMILHVPDMALFTPSDRRRLTKLANEGMVTAVLGPGVPSNPGPGIRGAALPPDPELATQWAVVTLSACSAAAMVARAVDDAGGEYDFAVTHDRQQVIAAARCLFRRLEPASPRYASTPASPAGVG